MSNNNDTNYLKAYSIGDSKRKLEEIQMILSRKIGNNWKQVIFTMVVLLVAVILLIIYGINIDDNPYKNSLSHIKVFFIIFILSICLFFVWVIIKPYIDTSQKGVVPFPPSDTLVPVDSSLCGTVPTLCENSLDCSKNCSVKDGQSNYNYSCYTVDHKNMYYLGSKLEVGKSYCLPNTREINDINDCGTYTGRIVWAKNPDNTLSWKCQCLYPDIFNGTSCTEQQACIMNYKEGLIPKKDMALLKDKNGQIWKSDIAPPSDSKTPYDSLSDGTPRFKCDCPAGFYSTNNDPFTCNEDICYEGSSHSDVAKFDLSTNQCICLPPTYKSNISGFCYSLEATEPTCNLNPNGGGCKYGISIFYRDEDNKENLIPITFSKKDDNGNMKYFMADKQSLKNNISNDISYRSNNIEQLVDVTNIVNNKEYNIDKTQFVDITDTILKDAFYSYEFNVKIPDISNENNYMKDIKDNVSKNGDMLDIIHKLVIQAAKNGGVAKKCNSYFYKRDGFPNCNDQLSKTGTEPIAKEMDCGGQKSKIVVDLNYYPWGYHCDCGIYGRKNPGCGKVLNGWHTVKNGDDSHSQIYGKYIDHIICNDYDKEYIQKGPQKCIEGCIPDGSELGNKDYTSCCFYEEDENKNVIKNIQNSGDNFVEPNSQNSVYNSNNKNICRKRARSSCSSDVECESAKGYNDGKCATMDKNNNYMCCPKSDYGLYDPFTGNWCSNLDNGEKCYYNRQCNSGYCFGAGSDKSAGGGICKEKN